LVPIPFNFNSIYILYPPQFAQELEHTLLQFYPYNAKVSIGELQDKAQSE
jgi:UDP-galactopyranose mutase